MSGFTISYPDIPGATRTAQTTTASGNCQVSTAQYVFGNASMRTYANASQLQVSYSASLNFGTGPFTIEMRIRPVTKATNFPHVVSNFTSGFSSNQWVLCDRHNAAPNNFTFWVGNYSTGGPMLTSTTTVSNDTWYAVAITRSGNTWRLFVNGNLEATQTSSVSMEGGTTPNVFFNPNAAAIWYNGYVDEIRFSNIARYTGTYTLATSPFVNDANTTLLLHCDGTNGSTSFPDDNVAPATPTGVTFHVPETNVATRTAKTTTAAGSTTVSTAQYKFANGSASIPGNGSALSLVNQGMRVNSTTQHTQEFWFKDTNTARLIVPLWLGGAAGTIYNWYQLILFAGTTSYFQLYTQNTALFSSNNITRDTNWHHFAWTTNGNTNTWYYDGNSIGSFTLTASNWNTSEDRYTIGAQYQNNYDNAINGYIDEIRISNIERYTSNFTPATQPFVNDSNTLLLLHCDGTNGSTSFPDDNMNLSPTGITFTL